jgi:hypothetical protein
MTDLLVPGDQDSFTAQAEKMVPEVNKLGDEIEGCLKKIESANFSDGGLAKVVKFSLKLSPVGLLMGSDQADTVRDSLPKVKAALRRAHGAVEDIVDELGRLANPGHPFTMRHVADNWDAVNTKLTGVVAPLDDGKFYATETWTDDMGRRYKNVPAGQQAALKNLIARLESMRTVLRKHADQILQMWWEIVEEIWVFVAESLPLAAAFVQFNPLKWLEVAESIADVVEHVLIAVKNLVGIVVTFVTASTKEIQALGEATSDATGTDMGAWPKARLV